MAGGGVAGERLRMHGVAKRVTRGMPRTAILFSFLLTLFSVLSSSFFLQPVYQFSYEFSTFLVCLVSSREWSSGVC